MERKLASIQKIKALAPIEGADKIEKATVLGWSVVVQKDLYKVGDLIIYCEVDSVLPERPEFEFLRTKHFRIKTVRLRQQISQGICFPLSCLDQVPGLYVGNRGVGPALCDRSDPASPGIPLFEGADVTQALGVIKYEVPIPVEMRAAVRCAWPEFLPHTDETRIQSVPQVLQRHAGKHFYATEKIDGTSMTAYLHEGTFYVCSRNQNLVESEGNLYWQMARMADLEAGLRGWPEELALQGEVAGLGVQGNPLKLTKRDFFLFNAFSIKDGRYLSHDEFSDVAFQMGLSVVPRLSWLPMTLSTTFQGSEALTVDGLVALATRKSAVNPDEWAEGIVLRPLREERDEDLGRLSFKVINPEYLLKHGQ